MNLDPDIWFRVAAAIASAPALRLQAPTTPVPRRIRSVLVAISAMTQSASRPQASVTKKAS
jgi:hypothetical protein